MQKKLDKGLEGFLLGGNLGVLGEKTEESVKKHGSDPLRRVFSSMCTLDKSGLNQA